MESGISLESSPARQNLVSAHETPNDAEGRSKPRETERSDVSPLFPKSVTRGRGNSRGKKRDLGRSAWSKQKSDKRQRNKDEQEVKRRRTERGDAPLPIYATKFSDDILAAEERRPKKKVAVLIGYSGTGYKGMQLTHDQKTIEGDLFKAFVDAGAISKANADDPKKSSFVRCARTDKGVHAAGNIISLKLIIEEKDIVEKINEHLSPQIRVWGYERTNNSFSAYQLCDSRIYEYLLPSYSLLPPHPSSYLGRKCRELAEKNGDLEQFHLRQAEVVDFWDRVDEEQIRPILQSYDEGIQAILEKALYLNRNGELEQDGSLVEDGSIDSSAGPTNGVSHEPGPSSQDSDTNLRKRSAVIAEGFKKLRAAYMRAKRAYRIDQPRLQRLRSVLSLFEGTRNFHNYTVDKPWKDPSAKRVIKSFVASAEPILINETEWLSLKVHGQSFMMHQIRKMVGMAALMVRCGGDPTCVFESYGAEKISIPKAPSLGLLLERPVFSSYNKRAKNEYGREPIDFDKYETVIEEFKRREIYARIYDQEEKENTFGLFFNHIDSFPSEVFLFVTSGGIAAAQAKHKADETAETTEGGVEIVGPDSDEDGESLINDEAGHEG